MLQILFHFQVKQLPMTRFNFKSVFTLICLLTFSLPIFAQKKYTDLGESLSKPGYHHICMHVKNLDATLAELKKRGVTTVGEPFYLATIKRNLAFIADPWGNLIELSEVVAK